MNNIKHFSFDLWSTLIKSNTNFKKERTLHFYKHFNSLNKSVEETKTVFRTVDLMCNATNERTGKNIDAEEMYLMVIYLLNDSFAPFGTLDLEVLYQDMEQLILQYRPVLFNTQTIDSLKRIKDNPNHTLNILSNTAFIKGVTLRKILIGLELTPYFDFEIYSDEVGLSKPNAEIYEVLLAQIRNIRKDNNISLDQIIHIGDNPIADIQGAESFGMKAFQINSNNKTINNLFD